MSKNDKPVPPGDLMEEDLLKSKDEKGVFFEASEEIDKKETPDEEEEKVLESEEKWDGTESVLVEDDDAKEYEESYSGVKLNYSLKTEELARAMKHCGQGQKRILEILLGSIILILTILLVIFAIRNNFTNGYFIASFFTYIAICGVLMFVLNKISSKNKITKHRNLDVEIFHDYITISDRINEWEIPLDGSSKLEEYKGLFLIFMPTNQVFVIPIRAIEPEFLPDVSAMLQAGTTPAQY